MVLGLAVLFTSGLYGCGSSQDTPKGADTTAVQDSSQPAGQKPEEKVTLSFWHGTQTPERNTFTEDLIKKFEAENPNITIDYLGIPGDPTQGKQKVDMAIAANTMPDVAKYIFYADFIEKGALQNLDEYFNNWKDKDLITEASIQNVRSADLKNNGLYALPTGQLIWMMWIRPDWFKEANIETPTTWDQFFDAAQKLTDKAKGKYGVSIRGGSGGPMQLEYLMYAYSGITEFFTADGKATINDPLNVEFVEKYLGLYNVCTPEDDLTKGWTELAATFQSGKAAMIFHNLGSADSHEKAFKNDRTKFLGIPFPKSVKGYNVLPTQDPYTCTWMSSQSEHKEEAWKFMTYLSSKDADSSYSKFYSEIPVNTEALKDAWIQEAPYMKMGADLIVSPETKYYPIPFYLPEYKVIQQKTIEPMIQEVMIKKRTAKSMLDEWAKLLEEAKKSYDASHK